MLQQSMAWRKWLMRITRKDYFSFAEPCWHWLFKHICRRAGIEANTSLTHNEGEDHCLHNAYLKKGRFGVLFLNTTTKSTSLIIYLYNDQPHFMNVQYEHRIISKNRKILQYFSVLFRLQEPVQLFSFLYWITLYPLKGKNLPLKWLWHKKIRIKCIIHKHSNIGCLCILHFNYSV